MEYPYSEMQLPKALQPAESQQIDNQPRHFHKPKPKTYDDN
jgi:hypothetical protein